jgi:hypothetical protein
MEIIIFARDVTSATVAYNGLTSEMDDARLTLQLGARVLKQNY